MNDPNRLDEYLSRQEQPEMIEVERDYIEWLKAKIDESDQAYANECATNVYLREEISRLKRIAYNGLAIYKTARLAFGDHYEDVMERIRELSNE